jgi:hypothetical protein
MLLPDSVPLQQLLRLLRDLRDGQDTAVAAILSDEGIRLAQRIRDIEKSIMSHGDMNRLTCFMLEFRGKDHHEPTPHDPTEVPDDTRIGGGFYEEAREFLLGEDLGVTEYGVGIWGWHVGAACTPGQAWHSYRRGQDRFRSALRDGALSIHLIPWSIRAIS